MLGVQIVLGVHIDVRGHGGWEGEKIDGEKTDGDIDISVWWRKRNSGEGKKGGGEERRRGRKRLRWLEIKATK